MIIVHLSDSYYPTIGGLERSIRTLANKQNAEGHDVHVVTSLHPDKPSYEEDNGVKVHRLKMSTQLIEGLLEDPRRPFHITTPDPIFQNGLEKVLKKIKPSIIHSHGWSTYSLIPISTKMKIPVVSTSHDYGHFCVVKQFILEDGSVCSGPQFNKCLKHAIDYYGLIKGVPLSIGMKMNVKNLNKIKWTALNETAAVAADKSNYEINDISVIPSYIPDESLYFDNSEKPDFLPKEPYILFVGGLTKTKGLHLLLEAYEEVKKVKPEMKLVLIGMPKNDTPKKFVDGVIIVKNQPNNIIMQAWKNAAVGVVPSLLPEAFGQVAVECIAAGTPVIVSNHGGLKDIVTDDVGIKIPPGSKQKLIEAILNISSDKDFRNKVLITGPKRASLFTVSSVYPKIMDTYNEVIYKK